MAADDVVEEIPTLPDELGALTSLGETAGYTDTFRVRVPGEARSAEAWARLILEQAPAPLRASLPAGWATLGLRHGTLGSDDHVLGWPMRVRTEDHLVLGADSRLGLEAELLIARWQGALAFATIIRFDNAATRVLWAGIELPHKRIVRKLLTHAAHLSATRAAEPRGAYAP